MLQINGHNIKEVQFNGKDIDIIKYQGHTVFGRKISQDWQGGASGTNIWGTSNTLHGYTGTQTSTFTFYQPQKSGKWSFTFYWSGQNYVTQYRYNIIVTYIDDTTETLHTGALPEYVRGGSGTHTDVYNFQKKWKSIKVEHSRSILDTIYCYSDFGKVSMNWDGSNQ